MSEFLVRFSTRLAGADQESRAPRIWNKLLPLLGDWYAGGKPFAAALWLADDDAGCNHTLWLARNSLEGARTPQPYCVTAAAPSVDPQILNAVFEAQRAKWVSPRFDFARGSVVSILLQHFGHERDGEEGRRRIVGAVTLYGEFDEKLKEKRGEELEIAANIAGSWLRLNREARIARALRELRTHQKTVSRPSQLAEATGEMLQNHASANLMWQVLVPDGANLRALASWRADVMESIASNPAGAGSPVHRHHFDHALGTEGDQIVLRFDGSGQPIDPPSAWAQTSFSVLTGLKPSGKTIAALIQRVRDREIEATNAITPPVVATILMVCGPNDTFVGGRFSRTNLRILDHIQDYFRNSYALSLQREKMNEINTLIVKAQATDVMNDAADFIHLRDFARLTKDILPTIIDAVIVEIRAIPRRESFYRSDGPSGKRPDWFAQFVEPNKIVPSSVNRRRFLLRKPIRRAEKGSKSYDLILEMSSPSLAIGEQILLERMVAEIQATMNVHLDHARWANQLAEVRHNLRAVVMSLISKAVKVTSGFDAVRRVESDVVYDRLITRAAYRKSIAQLKYSAQELLALTENIRTLSGGADQISLQVTSIDLFEMIVECIALFDEEVERRGIQLHFNDLLPSSLRMIEGDRGWLHILLFNLIENAIKYSRKNGSVDIRLWAHGPLWRLEVANEGKYIPESMRERVFDPYVRVDPEPGEQPMPGTGIGLASIKTITELHQIDGISVPGDAPVLLTSQLIASKPGQSQNARTVFTISIPRKRGGINA
jgi:signal transduction histidine kinase